MSIPDQLHNLIAASLATLGIADTAVLIQATPEDKAGDYGTPVAMTLAKALKKAPPAIANDIVANLAAPSWVSKVFVVGGFINFEIDPAYLMVCATTAPAAKTPKEGKVLLEHTSVNPNKELHVGHLRNVCLGDALSRILRHAGHSVEVANYIDDTGRQAAESLFALQHYGLNYDGSQKYDHFVGDAYVRLHQDMENPEVKAQLEPQILHTLHRLELGELRHDVDTILKSQLQTMHRLGAQYDVLVWESDIVQEGLLAKAMTALEHSEYTSRPTEGKYAGAFVMNMEPFIPGLEDPNLVLIRSNGTSTYTAKDIGLQFWKMGLLQGMKFIAYDVSPTGHAYSASHPKGQPTNFGGAHTTINVVDARQSHALRIVQASLEVEGHTELAKNCHHLAYETVLLEGKQMSGRKGIVVSVDEVLDEAKTRVLAIIAEKNPNHPSPQATAEQVAVGAVRFAMIKSEAKKQIDFRYDQALAFEGDTGAYIQYGHARACSILRKAKEAALEDAPNFSLATMHELRLAKALLKFEDIVEDAANIQAPHLLAQYLLSLTGEWSSYLNAKTPEGKPATRIIDAEAGLCGLRLRLVEQVRSTLATGLSLIGIAAPEIL